MSAPEHLQETLRTLPHSPGCYLMKNAEGTVIYVGKAVNLSNRVRSYFHNSAQHSRKTRRLVREIAAIEWIVVDSELEALILEMNLIKRYRPKYNVKLKDDKRYPYIKVHWQDPFPKVTVTRSMTDDGARYFGPYASVWAVHRTLDVLRRIFPYLTCNREITGEDPRACLYHDIKLCAAPCIGAISQQDYRQMIADLMDFLNGRTEPIVARLRQEMLQASDALRFERAAALRDQIAAIEKIVEKQKIISQKHLDSDVIALAREEGEACVQVFFIRSGKLIGREYFMLDGLDAEEDERTLLAEFIKQFYTESAHVPRQVLLPHDIEEANIIRQWLNSRRGQKVELLIPRRGEKRDLVRLAQDNAAETLQALRAQWAANAHKQEAALSGLQSALGLSKPPLRMECYDISNTQGTAIVASMVVFQRGVPDKKRYRRFNIRSVQGAPDDFASMEEALRRRFKRWRAAQAVKDTPGAHPDPAFSVLPDLLIVDGGQGQLSRAVKVLEDFDLREQVPVIGLAKQDELVILPGREAPLRLPRNAPALHLLQRIRDEAHRFAITAHRKKRAKIAFASTLDNIPGIGPQKRKALLRHFGSVEAVRQARVEELARVDGISTRLAETIKEFMA